MNKYEFKLMTQSWYKRRKPTEKETEVESFEVEGFQKKENEYCKLFVTYDNGEKLELDAKISFACTYLIGGGTANERWTVHGINHSGVSVLLKLIE